MKGSSLLPSQCLCKSLASGSLSPQHPKTPKDGSSNLLSDPGQTGLINLLLTQLSFPITAGTAYSTVHWGWRRQREREREHTHPCLYSDNSRRVTHTTSYKRNKRFSNSRKSKSLHGNYYCFAYLEINLRVEIFPQTPPDLWSKCSARLFLYRVLRRPFIMSFRLEEVAITGMVSIAFSAFCCRYCQVMPAERERTNTLTLVGSIV